MIFKTICQGVFMGPLKILGERLRLLRMEKRMRQVDIAELLGITQAHYQRIEKGKINIPTLTLCILADYFEVSTDYLLGRSEER
jgi:transcriptional regulator with XRE-family HTH domain